MRDIMSNIKRTYHPGEIVQNSGQMNLVGARGGQYDYQVTVTKGEPTPPTPKPNMSYKLTDLTVHHKQS